MAGNCELLNTKDKLLDIMCVLPRIIYLLVEAGGA